MPRTNLVMTSNLIQRVVITSHPTGPVHVSSPPPAGANGHILLSLTIIHAQCLRNIECGPCFVFTTLQPLEYVSVLPCIGGSLRVWNGSGQITKGFEVFTASLLKLDWLCIKILLSLKLLMLVCSIFSFSSVSCVNNLLGCCYKIYELSIHQHKRHFQHFVIAAWLCMLGPHPLERKKKWGQFSCSEEVHIF